MSDFAHELEKSGRSSTRQPHRRKQYSLHQLIKPAIKWNREWFVSAPPRIGPQPSYFPTSRAPTSRLAIKKLRTAY